jgi:hypothetical protein
MIDEEGAAGVCKEVWAGGYMVGRMRDVAGETRSQHYVPDIVPSCLVVGVSRETAKKGDTMNAAMSQVKSRAEK